MGARCSGKLQHAAWLTESAQSVAHAAQTALMNMSGRDADARARLLAACARGSTATVEGLLEAHADPNAAAAGSSTPLHAACANGHEHVVAMLLAAGARSDVSNAEGLTPRQCAERPGHHDCVALIDTHRRLQDNPWLR